MPNGSPGELCLNATIDLLNRFPGAPIEVIRHGTALRILPQFPEGFEVALFDEGDQAMISAERWHCHVDEPAQAAFCVMWLLTPYYRIVQELKGGVLVAAWLEAYESEGWVQAEPVFFLNPEHPESWIPAPGESLHRRYIQQAVLPPPRPYEEIVPGVKLDESGLPIGSVLGRRLEEVSEAMGPTLV